MEHQYNHAGIDATVVGYKTPPVNVRVLDGGSRGTLDVSTVSGAFVDQEWEVLGFVSLSGWVKLAGPRLSASGALFFFAPPAVSKVRAALVTVEGIAATVDALIVLRDGVLGAHYTP